MTRPKIAGKYHITWMEQWAKDFLDLEVQAFMQIKPDGTGEFQFGLVIGSMDCRFTERDGKPAVEFSWEGQEEVTHSLCGRGWAVLEGNELKGHLFIHDGDESAFKAKRIKTARSHR